MMGKEVGVMSEVSKQQLIVQDLAQKIHHHLYEVGDYLPSEYQLVDLYGASRNTIRKALDELTEMGFIQKIQGKGSVVLDFQRYAFPISGITSFKELNRSMGMAAHTKVLKQETLDQLPPAWSVPEAKVDKCVYLERLRFVDGEPSVYDLDCLLSPPVVNFPTLHDDDSVYEILENQMGLPISYATKEITVEAADQRIANQLKLDQAQLAVVVKSKVYLEDTSLVQLTISYHHPDKFRFIDFARRRKL